MIKNFFVTAVRNFARHKVFSFINVLGLSIGISAALVIYLIVQYDFSFDKFQNDRERIYRVVSDFTFAGEPYYNSGVPAPLPDAVRKQVTGIEYTAPFYTYGMSVKILPIAQRPQLFIKSQSDIILTNENYFKIIPYEWIAGSPVLLNEPFKVVLTENRARAYFPFKDITKSIGQTVYYDDSIRMTVVGIVRDLDQISDFTFKDFLSISTIPHSVLKENTGWNEWGSTNSASQLFLKLSKGADKRLVEKQINALREKNTKKEEQGPGFKTSQVLQPLNDVHFNGLYDNFGQRLAHKPTLYSLLIIAAFLLLLGCINFINLTTAQAAQRSKEIGIRKTLGSSRRHLVIQFLSETFLITLLAAIISIFFTPLILKLFSEFIPAGLRFAPQDQPHVLIFILLLIVVVTLLAGLYPAWILSGFRPVIILKNAVAGSSKSTKTWFRKTLTVSQFVIAQAFIMATFVVTKQIHYSLNKDMGFRKDAIVYFYPPYGEKANKKQLLFDKISALPGIEMVSLGGPPPASTSSSSRTMEFNNGIKEFNVDVQLKQGDTNFLKLYQIKLLAGRNLQQSDTIKEYVINETLARAFGFNKPSDAIGHLISREKKEIVGVVSDFNVRSIHTPIKPVAISCATQNHNTIHIALKKPGEGKSSWTETIRLLEKTWKEVYPGEDFAYNFLDEGISKFYKGEENIATLLKWAAGLAIFISCLGLLGLVMYTNFLRTKEIGVRKILGATVIQIVALLSREFIMLVIIAFAISVPIAWWAMNQWLQNFAYRSSVSWWIFILSGIIMVLIALLTMGYQTIRSASANPVENLRTE
ncbi:MAG TPA: FtsX-like permease family protein [Flavitalea sp.]|nr:FtsX-like permease family protein [Flavitalea sp.]